MKFNISNLLTVLFALIVTLFSSCKKYLDEKSDQKLVIPESVQDLQAILDEYSRVNRFDPSIHEISSDDYYLSYSNWARMNEMQRRLYIWEKDNLYPKGTNNDWAYSYDNVYRANVVLQYIDRINRTPNDDIDWRNAKGHAYFIRGKSFLQNAIIWSLAFDENTADTDLGIPLRTNPDFNIPSARASVRQTYEQIISDLKQSVELLPVTAVHVIRPSKPAAYALLARTYLSMRQYDSAWKYADACLELKKGLMDYNGDADVNPTDQFPIAPYNSEVLYSSRMRFPTHLYYGSVDTVLYNSYSANDLRRRIFFTEGGNGPYPFIGGYDGGQELFSGLATDEVYLMRSECYARKNNITEAMNDLNTLLIKRWETGTFVPLNATTQQEALSVILSERRKELVFRGLRWMDIKRLNKEGAGIVIKRELNGEVVSLNPNDLRYALPIPEDVIDIANLLQNPR